MPIQRGTGSIVVRALPGLPIATNITIAGNVLTIHPKLNLAYGTRYEVVLAADSVKGLAGIGYSGNSNYKFTTASQAVRPCTPTVPVTIQLFGDSTQVSAYDDRYLQYAMNGRFGVGAVLIELAAVSGSSSVNVVGGTDGLNTPWPESVSADIAMVNHGINDQHFFTPLVQYRANLVALTVGPAIIVFETPNPVHTVPWADSAYTSLMRDVAATTMTPLVDVEAYVLSLPNWQAHVPDGVHPDSTLQNLIATYVTAPALIPFVATLRCE